MYVSRYGITRGIIEKSFKGNVPHVKEKKDLIFDYVGINPTF